MKKASTNSKRKVSNAEKYEVYKYYFPSLPKKNVLELIQTGIIEKIILNDRWRGKHRLNDSETMFKAHVNGSTYRMLAKINHCSTRKITRVVNEERLLFISEIRKEIELGVFVIKPTERNTKKTDKEYLSDWKKFCKEIDQLKSM